MCQVSVIMSAYNENKKEIKQAIESILNQTFKNFEFIIVLDNPQNKILKDFINGYKEKDKRIKIIINKKNIGLANSLNKCINLSQGKYIARMDADDISLNNRIEKEYEYLEKNKNISVVSTNKIVIDENENELYKATKLPTKDDDIKNILKYTNIIVHPSVMFRKSDIEKIGNYRNFKTSQDYDLWMRVCSNNLKFGIIDEYLIKYRVRQNNISNSNPLKQWIIHEYILKLYKQRQKYKIDNFSEEKVDYLLEKSKALNPQKIKAFKKGMEYIELFKDGIKKKNIFSTRYLILAVLSHRKICKVLLCYVNSYKYKFKLKN